MKHQIQTLATALLLGTLASACATNSESGAESVANNENRVICRNEGDTGSRLARRTCRTATEWDEIASDNLEAIRNQQRGAIGGTAPGEAGRAQ